MTATAPTKGTDRLSVVSFYRFVELENPVELARRVESWARTASIRGTVLLAKEGVNATVSGARPELEELLRRIETALAPQAEESARLDAKWSTAEHHPFRKLRVRVRPEIVTFRQFGASPLARTARHASAEQWRELVRRDDVVVVDVRNDYEIHAGRFEGAISPQTESFVDFVRFVDEQLGEKDQTVAMYCTGGIRCEKASSYLLERGFRDVVQLDGGVLGYLEQVRERADDGETNEPWRGECFVFDDRVTLDRDLRPGTAALCRGCGWPILESERDDSAVRDGRWSCPRCVAGRNRRRSSV